MCASLKDGPRGRSSLHPMVFTRENYPLRLPLTNEDILSSLHLKVKSVGFATFSDISVRRITVLWKDESLKNINSL